MKEHRINQGWYFHLEDENYRKSGDANQKDELTTFGFFKTGEASGYAARRYAHLPWRRVDVPHDYVAELNFDPKTRAANGLKPVNDCMVTDDAVGSGRTEIPTFPVAWYRKEFFINEAGTYCEEAGSVWGDSNTHRHVPDGMRYFLRFEGVYRDFTVWVNGVYLDRI